jgi:riboflavin kinase/FMN adenylyltransferase
MQLLKEFCVNHTKKTVVTFGNFDGVHLGHQRICSKVIDLAKKENLDSVIITFDPHPLTFLFCKTDYLILNTEEKISLIKSHFDFNFLYIINFNDEFAKISAKEFIKLLHEKLQPKYIVSGLNCRFGNKSDGDLLTLKKYEKDFLYKTITVDYIRDSSIVYSSTVVREYLKKGDIRQVNQILGRKYSLTGTVISSNGLGSKIGYPTINLKINEQIIKPRFGVYDGEVKIDGQFYRGIINIGIRPTITSSGEIFLEMHIFNFSDNLLNKKVEIFFYNFIRDEKKFNSIDELKLQIKHDIETILNCS